MRTVFAIVLVFALATVASAATPEFFSWGNQAKYSAAGNQSFIFTPEASCAPYFFRMEEEALRFTAPWDMDITSMKTSFNTVSVDPNATSDGLAPTARFQVYADNGAGAPDFSAPMGAAYDFTVTNGDWTLPIDGGNTVTLTGGEVYHLYLKNTNLNLDPLKTSVAFKWAATTNAGTYLNPWDALYGNVSTYTGQKDTALAYQYYENYDLSGRNHAVYPKPDPPMGWTEGNPDDLGKSADPRFTLLDADGYTVYGQGISANSDYNIVAAKAGVGELFYLWDTGDAVGTTVPVTQVTLGLLKKGAPATTLTLKIYNAADAEVYSMALATSAITTAISYITYDTPDLNLIAGAKYTIAVVASAAGTSTVYWGVDGYAANAGGGVGFYGDDAYRRTLASAGGSLWVADTAGTDMFFALNIPEPATMVLLAVGAMGVLARRRRR